MPHGRLTLLALWAALACASAVSVSSPAELLSALAQFQDQGDDSTVELSADIALSAESAEAVSEALPLRVPGGSTLELRGADGSGLTNLDFGEVANLLEVQPGATLVLSGLNVSGSASPRPPPEDVETTIEGLSIWPSVTAEPGAAIRFQGSNVTLFPASECVPELIASQIKLFQRAVNSTSAVVPEGSLGARFVNFSLPLPVQNISNAAMLGTLSFNADDTTITCTQPALEEDTSGGGDGAAAGGGTDGGGATAGDGGGGTAGWVWAVVGVVAALAVAAAVIAALVWRRRARRRQQAQSEGQQLGGRLTAIAVAAGDEHKSPGSSGVKTDEAGASRSLGGLAADARSSGDFHSGMWRSRMGVIDDLQLGGVLGRGSYGHVYKGRWKGTTVAVKVVQTHLGHGQTLNLGREPLLSMALAHPNVLASFKSCVARLLAEGEAEGEGHSADLGDLPTSAVDSPAGGSVAGGAASRDHSSSDVPVVRSSAQSAGAASSPASSKRVVPSLTNPHLMVEIMAPDAVLTPGLYETWLISELADQGSLYSAIAAGRFSTGQPPRPDMPAIMLCLWDVARGLDYLHSCSIVHGDLKPQNVLLKTAPGDKRGYVCKLADFGLSRFMGDQQTHVDTGSYGTPAYAAPELLTEGRLTRAADVYSWAVLAWSLLAGETPFKAMPAMQILCLVGQQGFRPELPQHCPPALADLIQRCWQTDAQARPDAATVVREILAIVERMRAAAGGTMAVGGGQQPGQQP